MTQAEIKKLQARLDRLYKNIEAEVSSSTMDFIHELVECELLLEAECNK
jgi:hypothetical protein